MEMDLSLWLPFLKKKIQTIYCKFQNIKSILKKSNLQQTCQII